MARTSKRTEYCERQAAECASAAMTTTLSEAREAYLNMERAWLQLAPDVDSNQTVPVNETNDQQRTPGSKG
jgi:hypothetical protein